MVNEFDDISHNSASTLHFHLSISEMRRAEK